jgi:hypothetical protein
MPAHLPKLPPRKTRLLIITAAALLAMLALAMGLSQIEFKPGEPANLGESTSAPGQYSTFVSSSAVEAIIKALYGLTLVATALFIIYMLVNHERRKMLAKTLLRMLPVLALVFMASQYVRACTRTGAQTTTQPVAVGQATPGAAGPTPTFTPNLSPGLILAVSLILALLVAILVMVIIFRLRQANQRQVTPLMRLADQAQAALDALDAGGDFKNAVLRCYYEMNRILLEEKNLKREKYMTPREFESLLAEKGLPDEPVRQLTRLFEAVRYGAADAGAQEESIARASLGAIIAACRSAA